MTGVRKNLKCDRTGWCDRMDEHLAPEANAHAKGLSTVVLTSLGDGPPTSRCVGVAYKSSARDRGLLLNFCPWCGENIQFWETKVDHLVPDSPRPAG